MANQPNQPSNQSPTQNQKSGDKQSNQSNQQSRADQPTPVSASTQSQGQQQPSGDLKQMGREMASDAKEAAGNAATQVKEQVTDLTQNAQEQATSYLGEQKGIAADRLDGVASALRNVGQEFNERDEGTLAHYTDGLADQIERFSGSLRDREIGSLIDDARQLAYRQPEWFVAGALAVGFALGRFFKSSQRSRYNNRGYNDRAYGNPSDYTEGFYSNYARGYADSPSGQYSGGYQGQYSGGQYGGGQYNRSQYSGGQGSNYEGGTTSDYARGSYRNPESYSQSSRDYDAGYRADTRPDYQGSLQSTGEVTTHGLGTGQSVQREEEMGNTQNLGQQETLTANKSTQSNKPQGAGQGDRPEGERK